MSEQKEQSEFNKLICTIAAFLNGNDGGIDSFYGLTEADERRIYLWVTKAYEIGKKEGAL